MQTSHLPLLNSIFLDVLGLSELWQAAALLSLPLLVLRSLRPSSWPLAMHSSSTGACGVLAQPLGMFLGHRDNFTHCCLQNS